MDDVDHFEADADRQLALKPGLTGLWQVEGRSDPHWEQALQLYMYCVGRWSPSRHLILLARTMRVVRKGRVAS